MTDHEKTALLAALEAMNDPEEAKLEEAIYAVERVLEGTDPWSGPGGTETGRVFEFLVALT